MDIPDTAVAIRVHRPTNTRRMGFKADPDPETGSVMTDIRIGETRLKGVVDDWQTQTRLKVQN
jgi:hypothetical protein